MQPEIQSGISSDIINNTKMGPSKAYGWVKNLTGIAPDPEVEVDFDPLCPLPCLIRGGPKAFTSGKGAFFRVQTLDRAQPAMTRRPVPASAVLAMRMLDPNLDDIADPQVSPGAFLAQSNADDMDDIPL